MICDHVWQVFGEDGREFVFQVARKHLNATGMPGIEFAFSPEDHRKLRNEGTKFQELAQQAAMLQRNLNPERTANERLLEVYRLAEEAMDIIARIAAKRPRDSDPTADSLTEVVTAHARDGIVAAACDLAAALRRRPNVVDKWTFLLGLVDRLGNPEALTLVDQALSEILRIKAGIDALIPGSLNQSALVRVFLTLSGDGQQTTEPPGEVDLQPWIRAMRLRPLPWVMTAGRQRLAEVLAHPRPLSGQDPRHEWRALSRLRVRCLNLTKLPRDPDWIELIGRRANQLASPERLKVLLDEEIFLSGKILAALRLVAEVEDTKIKTNLIHVVSQLIEHQDFRRNFAPPSAEELSKAAASVRAAITDCAEIQPYRRNKMLETINQALTPPTQGRDKRQNERYNASPEDRVDLGGVKLKLRNWSPKGLLFDVGGQGFYVGQRLDLTVLIRNIRLVINFDATVDVVRIADGCVAAQYKFKDRQAEQKVMQFFG